MAQAAGTWSIQLAFKGVSQPHDACLSYSHEGLYDVLDASLAGAWPFAPSGGGASARDGAGAMAGGKMGAADVVLLPYVHVLQQAPRPATCKLGDALVVLWCVCQLGDARARLEGSSIAAIRACSCASNRIVRVLAAQPV
jgi:hypothetical protein